MSNFFSTLFLCINLIIHSTSLFLYAYTIYAYMQHIYIYQYILKTFIMNLEKTINKLMFNIMFILCMLMFFVSIYHLINFNMKMYLITTCLTLVFNILAKTIKN